MIEVLVASLCIIPASHFADKYRREPFVIVTFLMFTIFPISLMVSRNFNMLAVAFAIRGLKEFGDTSRKALIISYSEPQRRGQMVGAYYLMRDLIVSTGRTLGRLSLGSRAQAQFSRRGRVWHRRHDHLFSQHATNARRGAADGPFRAPEMTASVS